MVGWNSDNDKGDNSGGMVMVTVVAVEWWRLGGIMTTTMEATDSRR